MPLRVNNLEFCVSLTFLNLSGTTQASGLIHTHSAAES